MSLEVTKQGHGTDAGYVEVELDSSRASTSTFTSSRFGFNEPEPVTIKLKFTESGCGTIELPMEGRECFEKTIG